ncbi:MAG TPA: hypothetical protein VN906_02425 [Candidatus Sulfotelmatobacter sp.]|jgi:hypothetical protein|nr:hypothetical protein [Candidatus Sulfotelmatobacter sp.]
MGFFLRSVIRQLGLTGLIIVVAALVFGAIFGGVVAHRLEASPAANQEAQQGEKSTSDQQGQNSAQTSQSSDQKDEGQPKGPSHATGSRTTEPPDVQQGD